MEMNQTEARTGSAPVLLGKPINARDEANILASLCAVIADGCHVAADGRHELSKETYTGLGYLAEYVGARIEALHSQE